MTSNRPTRRAVLSGGLLAALAACAGPETARQVGAPALRPTEAPTVSLPAPTPTPAAPPRPQLEVMAGQMLMLGFPGAVLTPDNPVLAELTERHLGSVVLFSAGGASNVASPEQVAALTASLQEAAASPLLVAVDQEGGRVARLGPTRGFPPTLSARDLGRGDPAATRAASAEMARTLAAAGVTLNLAPVVDVDTYPANPVIGSLGRSFSADPAAVAAHAAAFVQGHHDVGVLTTLKHFPGHGSSRGDTHAGLVDVTATWDAVELEPYRVLVDAGLADAVMVAHVVNTAVDPRYPASLSAATINGLLRGELGYRGVVISDDLLMGAVAREWGFEEAVRRAVLAGTDIVLLASVTHGARAHAAILAMVEAGEVSEARIAASYQRVQALKARSLAAA
ncbi:glycoside hydrolase family 3 N-terminal domain-containing protein [Georgenia sp. M64]|uniref:glycoside hydrolase family 3 protein n=1 Tax=Georgenia sp. M64 TaxID=3120520 RepID=UPI0030E2BB6C